MKPKAFLPIVFLLLLLPIFFGFGSKPTETALIVTAVDAKTGLTVPDARVRIAETSAVAVCKGGPCTIAAPYLPDPRFKTKPPFGTCTLLVTAPGYVPTALIGCLVYQNVTRAVTVTLFDNDGSIADPIVSFSETPPLDWLSGLLIEPR